MTAAPTIIRDWRDLGYYVEAEAHEHRMEFRAYEVINLNPGPPTFNRAGTACANDLVGDTADAQIFLAGTIKWDGCSDFAFDAQEVLMLHFCSRVSATNIGVLIGRLYDLAAETIPAWSV